MFNWKKFKFEPKFQINDLVTDDYLQGEIIKIQRRRNKFIYRLKASPFIYDEDQLEKITLIAELKNENK